VSRTFLDLFSEKILTLELSVCIMPLVMKNKTNFKTGVRELSPGKLTPYIEAWFMADNSRLTDDFTDPFIWNQLAVAITTASGVQMKGSRLRDLGNGRGINMTAKARHGLCLVLGVREEEISEPLD
jgi:hypothetical protein